MNNLEPKEALKFINENMQNTNFVILDIRKKKDYLKNKIDKAINMSYYDDDFDKKLKQMNRNNIYLVYCLKDSISNITVETMLELGFRNVSKISGGINDWYKTGLEIISSKR